MFQENLVNHQPSGTDEFLVLVEHFADFVAVGASESCSCFFLYHDRSLGMNSEASIS